MLAKEVLVIWGDKSVPLIDLQDFVDLRTNVFFDVTQQCGVREIRLQRLQPTQQSLAPLIDVHLGKECTKVHDRVFALYALSDDRHRHPSNKTIPINYEATPFELLVDVAGYCVPPQPFGFLQRLARALKVYENGPSILPSEVSKFSVPFALRCAGVLEIPTNEDTKALLQSRLNDTNLSVLELTLHRMKRGLPKRAMSASLVASRRQPVAAAVSGPTAAIVTVW